MQKVIYTLDDKIHTVSEIITAFHIYPEWIVASFLNEENYMKYFGIFINAMIEQLGFDKTKKDVVQINEQFVSYIQNEFLPQYAEILWFDLGEYRADVRAKLASGLSL